MVKALSGVQNLVFAQAAAADGFLKIPVRQVYSSASAAR